MRNVTSRPALLFGALLGIIALVAASCGGGPTPTPQVVTKVVKETQIVEKEKVVTKVVEVTPEVKPEPVTIRFVSDTSPPPHPAAITMNEFGKRLKERIPGSEVRTYFAGGLYDINTAMEAASTGNLEMIWGQFGKAASFDPWMNIPSQPLVVGSPGAAHHIGETETIQMLTDRLDTKGIHTFGFGDLSFFVGLVTKQRMLTPDDVAGRKIRTFIPVTQNALLEAWGASPNFMPFGEVPSALQSGVIDGVLTSISGFDTLKEQSPYMTVAGLNAFSYDPYLIVGSKQWLNSLNSATREIILDLMDEMIEFQYTMNWCSDKLKMEAFAAEEPSDVGIFVLSPEEAKPFLDKAGNAPTEALKEVLPSDAHPWVDRFAEEARALTEQYPRGTDPAESADCEPYRDILLPE